MDGAADASPKPPSGVDSPHEVRRAETCSAGSLPVRALERGERAKAGRPRLKLSQKSRIVLEENANIRNAIAKHGNAFHTKPKGESGVTL